MKHIVSLLSLLLLINITAQDFAPVGSKWTYVYNLTWSNPGQSGSSKTWYSEKDTLINDIISKKLVLQGYTLCDGSKNEIEYIYSSNDSVFLWNKDLNKSQLLYNFDAVAGDSWTLEVNHYEEIDTIVFSIDSVYTELYNNLEKKVFITNYSNISTGSSYNYQYSSRIIEGVGDVEYLFNFKYGHICDYELNHSLYCYSEKSGYVFPTADACLVSTNVISINEDVIIYPNPTNDFLKINARVKKFQIISVSGKVLLEGNNTNKINVQNLEQGMYYIQLFINKKPIVCSFIKS